MGSAPDSRRQQRVDRLNAIFSWDFQKPLLPADGEVSIDPDNQLELITPLIENIAAIDATILRFAPKHDLSNFNKVDLAILRQALYELEYTNTPAAVVIDEAIELAKLYGAAETPSFVHGVLGNVVDEKRELKDENEPGTSNP